MSTAFRSSQSVTNGTAGTSVTVSKPAGIVDTGTDPDRDQLVAFIAATGAPTFTAPAGWSLITTAVDAGNNVTLKTYRRLADSEGASWTWTLGTSQRNWGWVGAYTGVDPDDVVADSDTDLTLTTSTTLGVLLTNFPADGQGIGAGAAVRTASGAATTWTHTGTERADLSTNAGAGTDIAGVVGDSVNGTGAAASYVASVVASQNQTAGALIALTLNPYFVPYGGGVGDTGVVVEAAFGVDPDSDSAEWDWTDLTSFVHHPAKLVLTHGRANRSSQADPSSMTFTLLNLNGEFTYPTGAYTDQMVLNLPFRVRLTGFGTNPAGDGFHRGTAFLASMRPRWDTSTRFAVVDIVAQGQLRRRQQGEDVLKSAAYTAIQRMVSTAGFSTPVAHWPFEDESGATVAASAVPGVAPISAPTVTFGSDTSVVGAAPLATLADTASPLFAAVPTYADTGTWTAMFCMMVPTEPATEIILMDVYTTGTATRWRLALTPGSPSQLTVQVFGSDGSVLFNSGVALTEATYYNLGRFYTFTATQSGADVSFVATVWSGSAGTAKSGTVTGRTAGTVTGFVPAAIGGLDGAGFGQLALHVEPGADGSFSSTAVVDGNAGDLPWARVQRLCQEQNIPYIMDQSETSDLTMGPQGVATFMSLARDAELVEGCVLNDSGEFAGATGLLWFPARDDRDNIDPTMTLDMDAGEIAPGFEPALDDQDIVNDFEASRLDGSSARVKDNDSIARAGQYRQGQTFNVEDDTMLLHLAGWRVNLGTVTGMRFPSVGWNMRRTPELAEQWLSCRLFHRVDIVNPPSQYPPDDLPTILEGYTETLSNDEWSVRANLSPYQPNHVRVMAETAGDLGVNVGRRSGDVKAAIRGAITTSSTSIPFDPNRHRWTTAADDFTPPLRIRIKGEVIDLSGISTTAGTFVAAGALSHADNAAVSPALYAGHAADDLILCVVRIRSTSAGTLATPTDYTRLPIGGLAATSRMQVFVKVHDGSESNPTVTPSGGSAGDTVSAYTLGLRGTPVSLADLTDIVVASAGQVNASAQNVAYPALPQIHLQGCVVLVLGGKDDDWTSVAALSGFTEAVDGSTTTGSDQGMVADYVIQTTPAIVLAGSLVVTGGSSAVSHGIVLALAAGYQTATVSARNTNGIVGGKAHAAGTRMEVEDAIIRAM